MLANAILELAKRPCSWRGGKHRAVDIFGGESSSPPHHHLLSVFVPLEDRSWTNAELLADVRRDRDLPLSGEL